MKLLTQSEEALTAIVAGKNLPALRALYYQSEPGSVEHTLAAAAMKVLVITQSVWPDEILGDAGEGLLAENFGESVTLHPLVDLYDDAVMARLEALSMSESPLFLRDRVKGFRVMDEAGIVLGMVVQSTFDLESQEKSLVWMIDREGRLLSVTEEGEAITYPAFAGVVGHTPQSLEDCTGPAELGALELAVLARSHARNEVALR